MADRPARLDDVLEAPPPRRRLPGMMLLPSAATLGNLICGVIAVLCCLLAMRDAYHPTTVRVHPHLIAWFPTWVAVGAYLVVLAMIFDALDGRLARITRRTTEFGAQLDSLADVVSFGVAPALLYLMILLPRAVPPDGAPLVGRIEWRLGLLAALVFVSCAAIRLARYNAENIKGEEAQQRFAGLPAPGAAAGLVALIVLHEDLVFTHSYWLGLDWAWLVRWSMGPVALLLGLLMISRIEYPHVFNVYLHREYPPTLLVVLVVVGAIAWFSPQVLLVVLAAAYVLSGPLRRWWRWRTARLSALRVDRITGVN